MSLFNQTFNQPRTCFGLCHDAPASGRPNLRMIPNEDEKKKELDNLLSQAFNELTFEEREEHQELLHGVKVTNTEDEALLHGALQELERHLTNIKSDSVYEMAESMDPVFVNARAFRAMFLRANDYDAKASSDQMLRFFESKQQLFGSDKLVKDITIDDFDEDDMARLKTSLVQLAARDRSGRQTLFHFGGRRLGGLISSKKSIESVLRAQYYVTMKALQSEETQLRGIVSIWYTLGELELKMQKGYFERFTLARALPQKVVAIHFCVKESQQLSPITFLVKVMQAKMRAKFKLHFGSLTECRYQLSTYGILPESLPLDHNGNINLDQHLHWVQSCAMKESLGRPTTVVESAKATPNDNDVLFTGGKIINHVGNQRFRALVRDFSDDYDAGTDEKKRQIVGEIVVKIQDAGGRFLKPQGKGAVAIWEEVPFHETRKKTMQTFRNRRRRQDACNKRKTNESSGILITGAPLPVDVIFGRAQRNLGNDWLQHLIVENFEEYESLNRGVKMRLVERIMKTIKDQGGRFLEQAPEKGRWVELPNDHARDRISKYFRNHRRPSKKVVMR
ncbi:unnamed protein product [Cylindrotheca closterium]|uniref:DUF6824 domain-containing protein n=1 Tax=Cylindrotheca closterium TaxID=2856 RepID=A0AAD2GA18_9STRA|nr:unnamed protein product [Cylindrotheca closterium]